VKSVGAITGASKVLISVIKSYLMNRLQHDLRKPAVVNVISDTSGQDGISKVRELQSDKQALTTFAAWQRPINFSLQSAYHHPFYG
jgi:hypothetical protein